MNPDFVFFDGQLWPYDEWAKIAPLTLLCPEKEPSPNARLWDEGYSNEQQKALLYVSTQGLLFWQSEKLTEVNYEAIYSMYQLWQKSPRF